MVESRKNTITKITLVFLVLFLLLLPVQLGKHFFFDFSYLSGIRVDYLAPTLYLTDIIALTLFAVNWRILIKIFRNKKTWIFLFLVIINLIFSQNKFIAFYRDLRIVEFLLIFLVYKNNRLDGKTILIPLLAMAVVELALALAQLATKHSVQGLAYFLGERFFSLGTPALAKASISGIEFLRPYGSFSHPNSLAGFYLLLYFFVLTSQRFTPFPILKNTFLTISSMLVFISFSKLAIVIFLMLNVWYLIFNTKKPFCWLCLSSKILVFIVISFLFLRVQTDPLSLLKRVNLFENSLAVIKPNLLFGVGDGNYLIAQNWLNQKYYDIINQPVHNVFLLFLAEWGLVGVLLTIMLVFRQLRSQVKKNWLVFSVIIITGFFDHYWLTLQQNFLLLAVVFGFL